MPLSELLADYERYPLSGEINSEVADQAGGASPSSRRRTPAATASTIDRLDGLTVSHADWTFNVRPSNTEPLLRLNAEGQRRGDHGARSATTCSP